MSDDLGAIAELSGVAAIEMVASTLAQRGMQPDKCHNCGTSVIDAFCAHCGQEHDTHRRSVYGLARDVFGEVATFDSLILRTAIALFVRPGELSTAFREGRPRRYVPAFRLYLFSSLIFFLVLGVSGIAIMQLQLVATPAQVTTNAKGQHFLTIKGQKPVPIPSWAVGEKGPHYGIATAAHFFSRIGSVHSDLTAAARTKLDLDRVYATRKPSTNAWEKWFKERVYAMVNTLANDPAAINRPLTEWIPRALFVLLPLFALLLAAFYWRQRTSYYFVDHLVFSLNMHSFLFVAILLGAALAQFIPGETVALLVLGIIGLYFLLSMKNFYRQSWFWTAMKFVSVSFIYVSFFVLPALGVIIAASLLAG